MCVYLFTTWLECGAYSLTLNFWCQSTMVFRNNSSPASGRYGLSVSALKTTSIACLLLQGFFIVTPVYAGLTGGQAMNKNEYQSKLLSLPSRPYTLTVGENTSIIAERLGLTVEQLEKYNQFRTFSKPFNKLSTGDEIDIPATDMKISGGAQNIESGAEDKSKEFETSLAQGASSMAGVLQEGQIAETAAGMARGMVTNKVNQSVQEWLGQFGTVQTQINLDDELSLENSSIDWLVPVYETEGNTFFTQLGLRNKDDRNTLNIGLGARWYTDQWLYGVNTFYDYDMTGENRRLGVGAELWRDYLQFSANGYFALSDWHQSRDFDDYDERPANGFDIRMNGWLPAMPQVGGKLMYEQYFGEEVALFGEDDRHKDAFAVTAGINYTPFPLMTVGVDHRMGKGDENETNINLQLTWKPGESWQSQISPESVAAMREIAGSKHNIVDRNYNIVLEYRKQELIKAKLDKPFIQGAEGSTHGVHMSVDSKYPMSKVNWTHAEFLAAGGTLREIDKTHFEITLPPYKQPAAATVGKSTAPNSANDNVYILTAVAEDTEGNLSPAQEMVVEVLAPALSFSGEMTVENDNAPADGKTPITVKTKLVDNNAKPAAGQAVRMHAVLADKSEVTADVITDASGTAVWELTSAVAGEAAVTATAGSQSQKTKVTFVDAGPGKETSGFRAGDKQIIADGKDDSKLVVLLRDVNNKPLTGYVVSFASSLEGTTISEVADRGDGTYVASLTGTQPGITTITASVEGQEQLEFEPVQIELVTAVGEISEMVIVDDNKPADGTSTNSVKVVVLDGLGQPFKDQEVTFTADNGASIAPTGTTDVHGEVTMTLTSSTAGQSVVTAALSDGSNKKVTVTFSVASNLVIYRGKSELSGNPVVDDVLTAVSKCENTLCTEQPTEFQWQVESAPGSGTYTDISGATQRQLVVTRDLQKRAIRVSTPD